jgi:PPOX class probable F420-dependent enzyme
MATRPLQRFTEQRTILLTTFKRDGTAVASPVNIAVDGDRAFIRTWSTAGKAKRLRHTSRARIAPSTFRGRVTGPAINVEVRPADRQDEERARQMLRHKYPVMHGVLVPLAHRLKHYQTVHYEVRPVGGEGGQARTEAGSSSYVDT